MKGLEEKKIKKEEKWGGGITVVDCKEVWGGEGGRMEGAEKSINQHL